jgi:hypothetical protein
MGFGGFGGFGGLRGFGASGDTTLYYAPHIPPGSPPPPRRPSTQHWPSLRLSGTGVKSIPGRRSPSRRQGHQGGFRGHLSAARQANRSARSCPRVVGGREGASGDTTTILADRVIPGVRGHVPIAGRRNRNMSPRPGRSARSCARTIQTTSQVDCQRFCVPFPGTRTRLRRDHVPRWSADGNAPLVDRTPRYPALRIGGVRLPPASTRAAGAMLWVSPGIPASGCFHD